MDITKITEQFSLRDYVAYLFPGLVLLAAIFVIKPEIWADIKTQTSTISLAVFVGGYLLGFIAKAASEFLNVKIADKLLGQPMSGIIYDVPKKNKKPLHGPLREQLLEKIKERWKSSLMELPEVEIMSLCWRDLQRHEHYGLDYLFRTITLFNIATNMLFPLSLIAVVLFIKGSHLLGVVSIAGLLSMYKIRYDYMREFTVNVYRIWFVINNK